MKIFVGNATRQYRTFAYRVPESGRPRTQDIPMGGQIQLTGDFSQNEVDAIVDQHRKYGLIEVKDIDRRKSFAGLCYQIDKPIRVSELQTAMVIRTEVLVERGKETRKAVALASAANLEQQLSDQERPEGLRGVETSFMEDNFDGREERDPLSEGLRVEPGKDEGKGGKGGRRGGGGKAK
jgi:hypothetical protein